MLGYIYILLFPSGKWYVGSTKKRWLSSRISVHKADLLRGVNSHLYNHIREIGWECMIYEILETIQFNDVSELLALEQTYIELHRDENCLNQVAAFTGLTRNEYIKLYKQKNADKHKEYAKQYRKAHQEKHKEYMKRYYKLNSNK